MAWCAACLALVAVGPVDPRAMSTSLALTLTSTALVVAMVTGREQHSKEKSKCRYMHTIVKGLSMRRAM